MRIKESFIFYKQHCFGNEKRLLGFGSGGVSYYKDKKEIKEIMNNRRERRITSQPVNMPTAGSVFRNPVGLSAGKLIEDAGLKGYVYGGAKVSEKHANFIVNEGTATYEDIIMLIDYIKDRIKILYNIDLILEQEIIR